MSAADDQADVVKVLAGDVDAFEGIVRRWQGPLVNMAFRFCRDRSRAEDMAQEAFLRAYRALGRWRQDGAFSTWLFAVAANSYRSELRRIPPALPLESAPEPSIEADEFERAEREGAVQRAVAALPPKYRDALVLFYFHEEDVTAASHSLGVPEGTLKARLSRGREMLRGKLSRVWKAVHA